MSKIPSLSFDFVSLDEDGLPIRQETGWVFDLSVPKVATEFIEGISSRVVIMDRAFYLVQVEFEDEYKDADSDSRIGRLALSCCADTHIIDDGVYKCTAMGPGIKGNPLQLPYRCFHFHEIAPVVIEGDVPTDPEGLTRFMSTLKSHTGISKGLASGIVWHAKDGTGRMAKVERMDLL